MADERIEIVIVNKIDKSIKRDLSEIGEEAKKSKALLREFAETTALEKLRAATFQTQTAQTKLQASTARLAQANNALLVSQNKVSASQLQTATAVERLTIAQNQAALSALRLQNAQKNGQETTDSFSKTMDGLTKYLEKIVTLLAIRYVFKLTIKGLEEVIELSREFDKIQNKLRNITESEGHLELMTARVFEAANRARVPVAEMAQAYQRFDYALRDTGKSQNQVLRSTETLSKLMIIGGSTAQEQRSAFLQLSQALNEGKLRGQEFRTVAQTMPMLMNAIADSMGVTRCELKKLGSEGKITSEVLFKALESMADQVDDKFAKLKPTIDQRLTELKNRAIFLFGEMSKDIPLTSWISDTLQQITKFLDENKADLFALVSNMKGLGDEFIKIIKSLAGGETKNLFNYVNNFLRAIRLLVAGLQDLYSVGKYILNPSLLVKDAYESVKTGESKFKLPSMENTTKALDDMLNSDVKQENFANRMNKTKEFENKIKDLNDKIRNLKEFMKSGLVSEQSIQVSNSRLKLLEDQLKQTKNEYAQFAGLQEDVMDRARGSKTTPFDTDAYNKELKKIESLQHARMSLIEKEIKTKQDMVNMQNGPANLFDEEVYNKNKVALAALVEELKIADKAFQDFVKGKKFNTPQEKALITSYVNQFADAQKRLSEITPEQSLQEIYLQKVMDKLEAAYEVSKKYGEEKKYQAELDKVLLGLKSKDVELTQEQTKVIEDLIAKTTHNNEVIAKMKGLLKKGTFDEIKLEQEAWKEALDRHLITQDKFNREIELTKEKTSALKLEMGNGDWLDILTVAMGKTTQGFKNMGVSLAESLGKAMETLDNGIANATAQSIVFGKSFSDSIKNTAQQALASFIQDLIKAQLQMINLKMQGADYGNGISGFLGSLFGSYTPDISGTASLPTPSSIPAFASGGYVNRPSLIMAGESGTEMVMNNQATRRYGPLLENMNSGKSIVGNQAPVNVKIENYGTSKDFSVEQISRDEIRIIANDEIRKSTPSIVASEISNPNSRVSKSLKNNTNASRRR